MKIRTTVSLLVTAIILAASGPTYAAIVQVDDLNIIDDPGNPSNGLRYLDVTFSQGLTQAAALSLAQVTYSNARLATSAEWDDLFAAAGITYEHGLTASDAFTATPVGTNVTGSFTGGVTIEDNDIAVTTVRQALGSTGNNSLDTWIWSAPDGSDDPATTRDVGVLSLDDLTSYQSPTPATGSHSKIGWLLVSDADTTVPEPTTLASWSLLGGIGLVAGHRRRRRKAA